MGLIISGVKLYTHRRIDLPFPEPLNFHQHSITHTTSWQESIFLASLHLARLHLRGPALCDRGQDTPRGPGPSRDECSRRRPRPRAEAGCLPPASPVGAHRKAGCDCSLVSGTEEHREVKHQPKYAQQGGCWKSGSPERVRRSVVSNFATPRTVARQAPLSMKFSSQECWSGLPVPAPGDLPNSGIEPGSPVLQADSLPCKPPGKPQDPLSQRHVLLLQEMRLIHGEAKEQSRGHTEREREKRDDWETKDWDFSVFLGGLGPGLPTRD